MLKSSNFIVAKLCDMDFSHVLKDSMQVICLTAHTESGWNEEALKEAIIRHMIGISICQDSQKKRLNRTFQDYEYLKNYFKDNLTLSYEQKQPIDGLGSAYFDVKLGESFLY